MEEQAGGAAAATTVELLRTWYSAFGELGRQFGVHLGMHSSDAAALVQITTAEDRGEPLTQTQLGRRIGLTAPATSTLLSRLEDAGHVQRLRGVIDRRSVTLRSTPAVHDEVERFFHDVGEELDRVAASYPAGTVAAFDEMIASMTGVLERHVADLTQARG